jgi:hypothetical protein
MEDSPHAPHDLIVVDGVKDKNIVVKLDQGDIVISLDETIRYSADKFRCFTFINCERCNVYILVKTTKILFAFCDEMKVSIRKDALGALEFYRCAKVDVENMGKIPLFSVEESDDVNFFQDASPQKYLVQSSNVRAITSLTVGTPASFADDKRHNISNMFGDQKIFTISSEDYSTGIYLDPFRKRPTAEKRHKSLPMNIRTGRDWN